MTTTRRLGSADLPAYADAQRACFGHFAEQRPDFDLDAGVPAALGGFEDGELRAKLAAYPMSLVLGGAEVTAHGIADVTVDIAYRGHGMARDLLRSLLRQERDRGAVLSVLYPSVPAVYRSYGYATVAARHRVRLDPVALTRARVADGLTFQRVHGAALQRAYFAVTAGREGVLRPLAPARPAQQDLAVRRGEADVALLRFERTTTAVTCDALLALDAEAWHACLALLGTETGGVPVDVWSAPGDPGWHWYPSLPQVMEYTRPMMRPIDVAAALASRGWPTGATGDWSFAVEDRLLPENSGGYRLRLAGGVADVERVAAADGAPQPVEHVAALLAGIRRPGDPQWAPLPDDLLAAAALRDWTVGLGF